MIAPDHWVPVTIASYRNHMARGRTYLLASAVGLTHGISSVILSFGIAEVGTIFLPYSYVTFFSVLLLVVIATYIIVNSLRESESAVRMENASVLVSVIPDPALVPFILLSESFGAAYGYILMAAFIGAAFLTLLVVVMLSVRGLEKTLSGIKPKTVDFVVAAALLGMAAFIYFFT